MPRPSTLSTPSSALNRFRWPTGPWPSRYRLPPHHRRPRNRPHNVLLSVSRLRQAQGLPPRCQGRRQTLPVVAEPTAQPLTPRRVTWLVLRRATQRTEAETQQLTQLRTQSPVVAEAIALAQDFAALVRQR